MIVRHDNRKKVILPGSKEVIYEILIPDSSGNLEFAIMDLAPNTSSCVDRITHMEMKLHMFWREKLNFLWMMMNLLCPKEIV